MPGDTLCEKTQMANNSQPENIPGVRSSRAKNTSLSRRSFLKGVEMTLGAAALSAQQGPAQAAPASRALSQGKGITNNLRSPHMKLKSVDVDSARWTSGLWAERFDTCAHATINQLWQRMEGVHFANFLRAVGDAGGTNFIGAGFSDGDL